MGYSINPHHIRLKLVSFIHSVSVYLIPLFTPLSSYILRLSRCRIFLNKNENKEIKFQETEPPLLLSLNNEEGNEFRGFDDVFDEEEKEEDKPEAEVIFKFKFPTFEDFSKSQKGTCNIFKSEAVPSSEYEFTSRKSLVNGFIDEPETFPVSEINKEEEPFLDQKSCDFSDKIEKVCDKGKKVLVSDVQEEEERENSEKTEAVQENFLDESGFCFSDENSAGQYSDSGSTSFGPVMDRSYRDGFLSDGDFGRGFEIEISDGNEELATDSETSVFGENQDGFADDEDSDIMEELRKLEEEEEGHDGNLSNPEEVGSEFLSHEDFDEDKETRNGGNGNGKEKSKEASMSDQDGNKLESLWEHQELIEQLKMELRNVRATGLPTILEESESPPKMMEKLGPWKIEDRFQHEDCIGEMNKFYKSYREKMRKFDILNYQKMYAMGFLQLKDPLKSMSDQKPSTPTLKSLVSQRLWLFKHKVHGSDPMKKFIKELQGDLEVVYVGQMCLSWEFLHWQYEKVLDLWDSDPRGIHRYNEVAGEFQQFQVLMQRFVEDEPFQGPRVQNYVKTRCVLRNLLQIPVIRDDNLRDKSKRREKDMDEYVITGDMLVEIMEESIRILWRFIRSDKDCSNATINGHKRKQPELHNPEDLELFEEIKKILQKKERKVKDLLRSENCILRKFRQCRENDDDSDQVLYFFSQVDMKLVARVLNMSKITRDQLMWCQNKLNRISFVNRKIYVEPSFLPFPC